jgi:hypothetical protein
MLNAQQALVTARVALVTVQRAHVAAARHTLAPEIEISRVLMLLLET